MNPMRSIILLTALAISAASCNSKHAAPKADDKAQPAAPAKPEAGIDLNCIPDHLQNPPESFHYSFRHDGTNFVVEEADVTPQAIDGSFKNNDGSSAVHGVHSDAKSWQEARMGFMGIGRLASSFAIVRNSSAIKNEGPEQVNGYATTKYSIDTARGTPTEASLYKATLGPNGFERGTVWVTSQGCPVKITLDVEGHLQDGSVTKDHYEEAMLKK